MRVTVATRIFAPEPAAAAFRLAALADELVARGLEVDVLTTRYESARSQNRGLMRVRRAPVKRSRDGFVRGYVSYLSFDVPLAFRLLVVRRPSVVVIEPPPTTGLVATVVCALRRVPTVWYAADVWSDAAVIAGAPSWVTSVLRRTEAWVMRRAAAVLAVSPEVADRVHELSGRAAIVVGNGVDTSVFSAGAAGAAESTSAPAGPSFVYAGTSSEFQGAGVFLDALAIVRTEHPDARLTILGGGNDAGLLAERAHEFDAGVVTVLARQSPEVAATHLRAATASLASIVPDVGYDFAVPTKIFASSACGTPVIFAGPDAAAARVVRSAPLGWAAAYNPASIAQAMSDAITAAQIPGHPTVRLAVAAWAEQTGSLTGVARRAADVVEAERRY
jgi:glycosyltransferase involved in cell wall biosynthesis